MRLTLGTFVLISLSMFGNAVGERFGIGVKKWLYVILMTQFHFMFYISRPLPNILALVLGK